MTNKDNKYTLLDLPILPRDRDSACGSSIIEDTYLKELGEIQNIEQLKEFIVRWRNLWMLDNTKVSDEIEQLLGNNFDHQAVLEFLARKKDDKLSFDDMSVRIMTNLAVPHTLLQAFSIANYWGVGTDLAMVRLYLDPYPELDDCLR